MIEGVPEEISQAWHERAELYNCTVVVTYSGATINIYERERGLKIRKALALDPPPKFVTIGDAVVAVGDIKGVYWWTELNEIPPADRANEHIAAKLNAPRDRMIRPGAVHTKRLLND